MLTTDLKTPTWKLDSGLEPRPIDFLTGESFHRHLRLYTVVHLLCQSLVCRKRDSNSHEPKARSILSAVRIPIPPSRHDILNQPNKRWDGTVQGKVIQPTTCLYWLIKTIQPVTWWLFRKRRFFISYFAKISVRLIIESMRQQPFTVSKLWIVYV